MLSLSQPLIVSYTYKVDPTTPTSGYRYFLQLHTTGSPTRIFLDPFSSPTAGDMDNEELLNGCGLPRSCNVPMLPGCVLAPLPAHHSAILHQIYTGELEQGDTWKTRSNRACCCVVLLVIVVCCMCCCIALLLYWCCDVALLLLMLHC